MKSLQHFQAKMVKQGKNTMNASESNTNKPSNERIAYSIPEAPSCWA